MTADLHDPVSRLDMGPFGAMSHPRAPGGDPYVHPRRHGEAGVGAKPTRRAADKAEVITTGTRQGEWLNSSSGMSSWGSRSVKQVEEAIARILAKVPAEQRRLADGRDTRTTLVGMVREWAEINGGAVEIRASGSKWVHLSDDSMAKGDFRPMGLSTDLCAISNHAAARTFASGYRDAVFGNAPPVSYWCSTAVREDVIPIMLAVLDRELTGALAGQDWYLQTPCTPRLCLYHPDDSGTAFCGSASCALASPHTPCDCVCGGFHHGMGEKTLKAPYPGAPDWSTAPSPVWRPGTGTVEIDPTHRRIIGRDPSSQHGARVRPPTAAGTAAGEAATGLGRAEQQAKQGRT